MRMIVSVCIPFIAHELFAKKPLATSKINNFFMTHLPKLLCFTLILRQYIRIKGCHPRLIVAHLLSENGSV